MKKTFKNALRYWFAITSVLSFLGGWIILAHSPKPVQQTATVNAAPLLTLPPIQAFGDANNNGLGFFSPNTQSNPQPSTGFRRLRTGGS
jgi:hypothetical protein